MQSDNKAAAKRKVSAAKGTSTKAVKRQKGLSAGGGAAAAA